MESSERYVVQSLELHLFFARIMKEHALFLMAGFTPVNAAFTSAAEQYKTGFEGVLSQAASLGDGVVGREALASGEFVTPFTAPAERQTEFLTGIPINQTVTAREGLLRAGARTALHSPTLVGQVQALNQEALGLLNGLISLKEQILSHVLSGRMFTMNYPLLLEHIIREAKLYREYVQRLETDGDIDPRAMGRLEQFWNQIMMEHALFIRGLLDPAENDLVETADSFAKDFAELLERSRAAQDVALTQSTLAQTRKFRDFKAAGVKGIEECKIRSIILPLLADHVLREANHYVRLLSE